MTNETDREPVVHAADLSLMERTYLGVLDMGMVPARLAGDPTLRLDSVTAVCLALREGKPATAYLDGAGPEPAAAFLADLNAAAFALDEKGIISVSAPPPDSVLSPDLHLPAPRPAGRLDFDQRPRIWKRYLAHECMEELFSDSRVYPFLMGKYQDSGEVWARLYKQNPQQFL
jgi:hypothetical protein